MLDIHSILNTSHRLRIEGVCIKQYISHRLRTEGVCIEHHISHHQYINGCVIYVDIRDLSVMSLKPLGCVASRISTYITHPLMY